MLQAVGGSSPEPITSALGIADLQIEVAAGDRASARRAERVVFEEIDRLTRQFRRDDPNSTMSRWIENPSVATSNELDELLAAALFWQERTSGVFNVSTRPLGVVWTHAAADGCRPSPGELHEIARDIAEAPYRFDGHVVRQVKNCRDLDLDAIASGFVLDLAVDAAWRLCDLEGLTVRLGHCERRRGSTSTGAMLGDSPADQFGHLRSLALDDGAVVIRRGGGAPNVFDPRTGARASDPNSVIVVAQSACAAQTVAIVLAVLTVDEGREFVDKLNGSGPPSAGSLATRGVLPDSVRCWWFDEMGRDLGDGGSSPRSRR